MAYNDFDPYADNETVQTWQPPWGANLPAPPIYNRPGNPGRGGYGGVIRARGQGRNRYKQDGTDGTDEILDNQVGYETDWKYPNWLIRMAQWRNF